VVERTCEHCGKAFKVAANVVRRGYGKFCSRSCTRKGRTGERASNWRGGLNISPEGYRRITVTGKGTIFEHRHVMEEHLGYTLPSNVHVHHINGIKDDNRIENLALMRASEHLAAERDLRGRWSKRHDRCIDCEKTDLTHHAHGRCERCYYEHWYAKNLSKL